MKATEWFAIASAEGAFCGREDRKFEIARIEAMVEKALSDPLPIRANGWLDSPQVVDCWNAATRRFDQIWSDTGLPYNPKVHGGR